MEETDSARRRLGGLQPLMVLGHLAIALVLAWFGVQAGAFGFSSREATSAIDRLLWIAVVPLMAGGTLYVLDRLVAQVSLTAGDEDLSQYRVMGKVSLPWRDVKGLRAKGDYLVIMGPARAIWIAPSFYRSPNSISDTLDRFLLDVPGRDLLSSVKERD